MLKSLKRFVILVVITLSFMVGGCRSFCYNESRDEQWITQQIKNGSLTEAEANEIRNQMKNN